MCCWSTPPCAEAVNLRPPSIGRARSASAGAHHRLCVQRRARRMDTTSRCARYSRTQALEEERVVYPQGEREFVARMEDVLDLYQPEQSGASSTRPPGN